MKRLITLFLAVFISTQSFATQTDIIEKQNISRDIKSLMAYEHSGKYTQDIQAASNEAIEFLGKKLHSGKKLAIVLDIDETVLSNYPDMERIHFTANKEAHTAAYMQGNDPAIIPMLKLFRFARQHNVDVFFVTGRPDTAEVRKVTEDNLHKAGYNDWKALILRPLDDTNSSVVPYKSGTRHKIIDMGYDIVLNMGDQQSDLDGGFADKAVKLPNPFYTLS